MIDRAKFFAGIRSGPFPGTLTPKQVEGVTKILDEWERRKLTDLRWLAYILATAKWETANTMQPVREMGGEAYLRSKRYYPWVGEGLVQTTWEVNHRKFGATAPGQMMGWPIALRAIYDGMIGGMFTGKKLGDYFNATKTDWVNARRIVNGTDKAAQIAEIAKQFYADLVAANMAPAASAAPPNLGATAAPAPPKPASDPAKDAAKTGAGAAGGAIIVGGAAAAAQQGVEAWVIVAWIAGISAAVIAIVLIGYRIKQGYWPWNSTGNQSQELSLLSLPGSEPSLEQVSQVQSALLSAASPVTPSPLFSESRKTIQRRSVKPLPKTRSQPRKSNKSKPSAVKKSSLKRKSKSKR